jgi:3'-5' exoribonuclease
MINEKVHALRSGGAQIDPELLDALTHIILSHHGQYEFGSPKLPATAEAFMVCYIDDMDAKINQVTSEIASEQSDSNWTAWVNSLQTRLYRKRIE